LSIAATLFELLTGQTPFEQRPGEGAGAFIRRVGEGLPDDALGAPMAEPARKLLTRGLGVDRDARIGSVLSFASGVRETQTELGLPATPAVDVDRGQRRQKWRKQPKPDRPLLDLPPLSRPTAAWVRSRTSRGLRRWLARLGRETPPAMLARAPSPARPKSGPGATWRGQQRRMP